MIRKEWLDSWCWGHHCIDKVYGVDHGDCVYLPKEVLKCTTCDTSQLELMFNEIGVRNIEVEETSEE